MLCQRYVLQHVPHTLDHTTDQKHSLQKQTLQESGTLVFNLLVSVPAGTKKDYPWTKLFLSTCDNLVHIDREARPKPYSRHRQLAVKWPSIHVQLAVQFREKSTNAAQIVN